tara:strand:- start:1302 stop:1484 length:183 start_codon:yes stop_codon:yes gene_type:complete
MSSEENTELLKRIDYNEERMEEIEDLVRANSELLEEIAKQLIEIKKVLSEPQVPNLLGLF